MPVPRRRKMTKEVSQALQKRDIDELRKDMNVGFVETHRLQSLTNGKVLKAESDITDLKNWRIQRSVERKYEKLIWFVVTTLVGAVVGLSSWIIYHKDVPQATTITIPGKAEY